MSLLMKKLFLIIFILINSLAAKAQKNDTTIYFGCIIKGDTTTYIGQQPNTDAKVPDCTFYSAPKFPGDEKAFHRFLSKNLKWPNSTYDGQGKVIVRFVIEKNGNLSNIKLLHAATPEFGKEAIRVIKLSPKWIPGKINGKPIRHRCYLAVPFKID